MAKVELLFENSALSQISAISKQLSLATTPLSNIGLATSKLFENSALSQMSAISKQLSLATLPLSNIGFATSKLFENSALSQISAISKQLSLATLPLSNIGFATSKLFENSALSQMSAISKQLSLATLPLSNIGFATSKLFENSALSQFEVKLKFISENICPITELDINELTSSEIEVLTSENDNFIETLEELKINTFNNKFKVEEINQKLEQLLNLIQKQKNSVIINILLGLMVSIIFTYCIQPIINNFSLNKSQINKILVPEVKKVLKPNSLSRYRVVIVKTFLNIRTKPKLKSRVISHLSNGDLVEIVNKQKNWTLIKKYDSEYETIIQGWVNTRYLLKIK